MTNLTQPLLLNVVKFSNHIKVKVGEVDPGYAVLYLDAEEIHFNGNGTSHGGVYTSLIDNAMGLSVSSPLYRDDTDGRAFPGSRQGGAHRVLERGCSQDAPDGDRGGASLRPGGEPSDDGNWGVQKRRETGGPDRVVREIARVREKFSGDYLATFCGTVTPTGRPSIRSSPDCTS